MDGAATFAAHATLGASSAHRWLACPASVRLTRDIPSVSSPYAEEGTRAHAVAETALRLGVDARTANEITKGFGADQFEDLDAIDAYIDHVRGIPGELFVEQRVHFDQWVPGGFGTADSIRVTPDTLRVTDLKFGRGVRVDATENPQLKLYGLGALAAFDFIYDFSVVELCIVQPRLGHVSAWSTTPEDLRSWGESIRPAAELALTDDAPVNPGEPQCRFCDAAGTCRALSDHVRRLAFDGFGVVRHPDRLSDDELSEALTSAKLVRHWADAVERQAVQQLHHGHLLPGFKLVRGRSSRKWRDETQAEKALARAGLKKDERFDSKLISPAQAEKRLGKHHAVLTKHATRLDGKPTVAPTSDPRPAIAPATDGFEPTHSPQGD